MKIIESAANKRWPKDTLLVEKDLNAAAPPPRSFCWNMRNEVEIALTAEKITKATKSSRSPGSTYCYTTTLTVPDLLSCLEKAANFYDDHTREWVNRWDAAEKAVALSAIALLRVLLTARKPTPQPRANKNRV